LVQASHEIYRLTSETEKLEGQRDSARKFAEELMGTIRKEKIKRTTRYIMNMDLLNPALKKIIDDRIEASSDDE
jgi:hypothetical protein